MYLKTLARATCAAALVFASCSFKLPWSNEPVGDEVNVVFTIKNNLLFLPSVTLDGHPGRFLLGSANPQTVVDSKFAQSAHSLQLNERQSLPLSAVVEDLHGVGDAIIGADAWGRNAITIDFRAGLLTLQKYGIRADMMTVYTYSEAPMVNVIVDGRTIPVVIDTLTLRSAGTSAGRRRAHVQVAGTDFGSVDVQYADVASPRIGNRLLSRFLVTIDSGRRMVGLWRDPRIAL